MSSETPSWLAKRAQLASKAQPPPPATKATSAHDKPSPRTNSAPSAPQPTQNRPPRKGGRAGNHSDNEIVGVGGDLDIEALADLITASAKEQRAAELMRPALPDVLRAMIRGAQIPGPGGASDRKQLFAVLGSLGSATGRGDTSAKAAMAEAVDKLAGALAVRERLVGRVIEADPASFSRVGATLAAPDDEKASPAAH
jgi:hypothetical protein